MTTARLGVFVAACVAMAALAAAVVQAQEPTMSLPNATVTAGFGSGFQPAEVVIPAGGAVEWKNASIFVRAITDDPALARGLVGARLPAGTQPFDSGAIAPGGAWRSRERLVSRALHLPAFDVRSVTRPEPRPWFSLLEDTCRGAAPALTFDPSEQAYARPTPHRGSQCDRPFVRRAGRGL